MSWHYWFWHDQNWGTLYSANGVLIGSRVSTICVLRSSCEENACKSRALNCALYSRTHLREVKGRFRLQWRSAHVKNFRGMEQYDWLRNGFFIDPGLHYGQDFSGGELHKHGWENDMLANMRTFFLSWGFSRGQVSWATSNPWTKNLTSEELHLEVASLFSFSKHVFLTCYAISTVTLNNLVLGWSCWPTYALLHQSLNQPYISSDFLEICIL